MNEFLRREIYFLRRPLNWSSRLIMIVAAGLVVAAVFLPLWQIRLVAPQYQEGLSLKIYSYQLVGGNGGQDLVEINGLNHYIGMRPLQKADFVEMTWLPFAFGIFALLALRAAVIGRMASLVDLGVLFLYFGAFSMGSFYYRLYSYGHHLDPRAPVTMAPFTPVMIGSQKLANFIQTSLPESGAICLGVFPAMIALAMWLSRKEQP
jgi:hypothetical protein